MVIKAVSNRYVLRCFLNVSTVRQLWHLAGRLFQAVAEVCPKDHSAKVEWARFTTSMFWFTDRRFLDRVYGWANWRRQDGRRNFSRLKVTVAILKVTRWRTDSQWSWTSAGVMWSWQLSWWTMHAGAKRRLVLPSHLTLATKKIYVDFWHTGNHSNLTTYYNFLISSTEQQVYLHQNYITR